MTTPEQPEQIDRENAMTKASETLIATLIHMAECKDMGRGPAPDCPLRKAATEITRLQAEVDRLREVVATARASTDFILGCFQAAEAEGISQRIHELEPDANDPASISGILARRINWAYSKAQELSAVLNGDIHD